MSTFKQKSLFAALAGLGVLGVVDSAQAVHINQDGLGQALIYPYYTARSSASGNAYVTALSVVNTTASAKAVKVRFLEGKNSKEVLDFNLFLSQYDVWTAGIVPAGGGAGLFTDDNSCTSPVVSNSPASPIKFRNGAYIGDSYLPGDAVNAAFDSLDRTYEGYFEILEMGTIADGTALWSSVTHKANLSSADASAPPCTNLPTTAATPSALVPPTGGLFGTASLINVNDGTDMSYDATALDGWSDVRRWSAPGDTLPTIASVSPARSIVVDNNSGGGRVVITDWSSSLLPGPDAVTAVMMRSNVYNEYTVEPDLKAATDWVVTMPTKTFYVDQFGADRPFESAFDSDGSCDTVVLTYYDREEQSPGSIVDFSPTTPHPSSLCWEANVLTFTSNGEATKSHVLQSTNEANISLNPFWIRGWADLTFPQVLSNSSAHNLPAVPGATTIVNIGAPSAPLLAQNVTYFGLPVVGFAVQSFTNGFIPSGTGGQNVLSNYGGSFNHKYKRDIR